MKEYTLSDTITINRPIVFLCGPLYDKNNESDRRKILQEKIYSEFDGKYLPLVVDDFLTKESMGQEISIQIMEEICAAISLQTYIFLDTISSAAELGIFVNSAFLNKVKVYVPKINDIYNKGNVGFFVKEVVLKDRPDKIEVLEYRPKVQKTAVATDYFAEFYSFVNDVIPNNITKNIEKDGIYSEIDKHKIEIVNTPNMPQNEYQICYKIEHEDIYIHTSIKVLFYATISIIYCEYKGFFEKKEKNFAILDIEKIEELVIQAYVNLLCEETGIHVKKEFNVHIDTVLKESLRRLAYHMAKFLHVYNISSDFKKNYLLRDPQGKIIEIIDTKRHYNDVFNVSDEQSFLLKSMVAEPDRFYEKIVIKKGKRKRELIKYRETNEGEKARKIHEVIMKALLAQYTPDSHSYAYQKGKSIRSCVEEHLLGRGFAKYDIKKFFNSITISNAVDAVIREMGIDIRYKLFVSLILKGCFWGEELPLGLVSSPIISDICMKAFDEKVSKQLEHLGLKYTRYADDILVSSLENISEELYASIDSIVKDNLEREGLILNEEKKQYINFDESHSFIRYLGINIVKGENANYLSVGRRYIYDVAKEYILYEQETRAQSNEELSSDMFYQRIRLIGKIGFIMQIEGEQGIIRLEERLKKYYPELDLKAI